MMDEAETQLKDQITDLDLKQKSATEKDLTDFEEEETRSSSTEGPDTPDQCSSPSPAMLHTEAPSVPLYTVRFTDNVSKSGDRIQFTINVRKLNTGTISTITREYEDLAFLDHQLITNQTKPGLIFPPLPPPPIVDPSGAESRSRQILGSSNRNILGDSGMWAKNCRELEKYLELVVQHPVLGIDPLLQQFLDNTDPPPRPNKVRKGWLSGVKTKWEARNSSARDRDEWFSKEREWVAAYSANIKDASDKFNEMIASRSRLIQQVGHLAAALNITVAGNEGANGMYNKLNSGFSSSLESIKCGMETEVGNEETSLGNCLELYTRCINAENAMLMRRTSMIVDADAALKAVEKAKPNREQEARDASDECEDALEKCSSVAKQEIKRFHQQRLADFRSSLISYVEGEVQCSRENYADILKSIEKMKSYPVPKISCSNLDPNHNT